LPKRVEVGAQGSTSEPDEVVFGAQRGEAIRGTVLAPGGTAGGLTSLEATRADGRHVARTESDGFGRFTLFPLLAGLPYRVRARGHDWASADGVQVVAPGTADVQLSLAAGGGLQGSVLDPFTGEHCEATLVCIPARPDDAQPPQRVVTYAGRYLFVNLPPGPYTIVASASSSRTAFAPRLEVRAGELVSRDLILATGATLRLTLGEDSPPARFEIAYGADCIAFDTLDAGQTRELLLPPGVLTLRTSIGDRAQTATLHLAAHGTSEIALPLPQ
jgi:hypothetical protein